MARDPAVPPPSERPPSGQPEQPGQRPPHAERFGIVSITRHVKDDGRALLLFTREERAGS
jgi:hypothetical protein